MNELYLMNQINQIITNNVLFIDYVIKKQCVMNISAKQTNYDFILEAHDFNRWMLFRVVDFYKYQKVIIWINLLELPKPENFDLETYFFFNLKIGEIVKKLTFNCSTENDFVEQLKKVLCYILNNLDENGKLIFHGKLWIDMPFDWHEYK